MLSPSARGQGEADRSGDHHPGFSLDFFTRPSKVRDSPACEQAEKLRTAVITTRCRYVHDTSSASLHSVSRLMSCRCIAPAILLLFSVECCALPGGYPCAEPSTLPCIAAAECLISTLQSPLSNFSRYRGRTCVFCALRVYDTRLRTRAVVRSALASACTHHTLQRADPIDSGWDRRP